MRAQVRADRPVHVALEPDPRGRAEHLEQRVLSGEDRAVTDAVCVRVVAERNAEFGVNTEPQAAPSQ